jgi:hypothetical protein
MHEPSTHCWPEKHPRLHAPQCCLLLDNDTHASPHFTSPVGHGGFGSWQAMEKTPNIKSTAKRRKIEDRKDKASIQNSFFQRLSDAE